MIEYLHSTHAWRLPQLTLYERELPLAECRQRCANWWGSFILRASKEGEVWVTNYTREPNRVICIESPAAGFSSYGQDLLLWDTQGLVYFARVDPYKGMITLQ